MAETQAIFYRDKRGVEPVDRFIDSLPAKRAAKIDAYIEEHLNGQPPEAPPPEHPITSQIEGELRELRVRFANTRYRILYQRSGNLIVLLHAFEKDTGQSRRPRRQWRSAAWLTSSSGWMPSPECDRGQLGKTRHPANGVDLFIDLDKLLP